jgi:hypothetical protein
VVRPRSAKPLFAGSIPAPALNPLTRGIYIAIGLLDPPGQNKKSELAQNSFHLFGLRLQFVSVIAGLLFDTVTAFRDHPV